jgi:hypothetical protein
MSELADLSHQLLAAIQHRDRAVLDAVLHPEFVQISEHGVRTVRAAFIDAVIDADFDILDLAFDSLAIDVFGDVGVAAGVQRGRVWLATGDEAAGRTAFTDVFVRENGRWLLRLATSADLA